MTWTIPIDDTAAGRFARELALLLGPAHGHAPSPSRRLDDLMALGAALADAWQRQRDAVDEAHPATADELLAELESEYGLPTDASLPTSTRRSVLLAKVRARYEGTRDAIETTCDAIVPGTVIEYLESRVDHIDPNCAFRFVLKLAGEYGDPDGSVIEIADAAAQRARLLAVIRQQKPAHTAGSLARNIGGFLCDDAGSRCDYDALDG